MKQAGQTAFEKRGFMDFLCRFDLNGKNRKWKVSFFIFPVMFLPGSYQELEAIQTPLVEELLKVLTLVWFLMLIGKRKERII